jgi:hypothetical protein
MCEMFPLIRPTRSNGYIRFKNVSNLRHRSEAISQTSNDRFPIRITFERWNNYIQRHGRTPIFQIYFPPAM